jgi:hypothetical protein
MIEELRNIKSGKRDLRNFGITIGVVLLILAGFLFWKERQLYKLSVTVGVILLASGLTVPSLLKPVYWVWMVFATILGWVMTRLILTVLFYAVITPIGLVSRLFGKQFLERKWSGSTTTYWTYRVNKGSDGRDHERQF